MESEYYALYPVQGELVYALPLYCAFFCVVGLLVTHAYHILHPIVRIPCRVAGTFVLIMQAAFMAIDISSYDGLSLYDGLILPFHFVFNSESWYSSVSFKYIALPSLVILSSYCYIIWLWIKLDGPNK